MSTDLLSRELSGKYSEKNPLLPNCERETNVSALLKLRVIEVLEFGRYLGLEYREGRVSRWSHSFKKRIFDLACVFLALPLLIPVFLAIAIAIRISSSGPVFFTQERMGRRGRPFTIFKFRTMEHLGVHKSVTTSGNQRFTPIGPFLRRWKLDELPQLLNVIRGEMSLVGPRPKLSQHQVGKLSWRPGITGAATFAFAREEEFLAAVPDHKLDFYYHSIVLPAKRRLDNVYMSHSTFTSDLRLLVDTVLRRFDRSEVQQLLKNFEEEVKTREVNAPVSTAPPSQLLTFDYQESLASGD